MLLLLLACTSPSAPPPLVADLPVTDEVLVTHAERPPLFINEVMAKNASAYMTDDGALPDWIELVNRAGVPLDLSRASLVSGDDVATVGDSELLPGGHVLLLADGLEAQGHLPFALASDGEELVLTWDGVAIDRLRTGPLPEDVALARFPDGGAWAPTARATPGFTNGAAPSTTLDPSDALFDEGRVHAIELTLAPAQIAALEAAPYTDVPAAFAMGGFRRDCVAVRKKGVYGSLRSMYGKPALKIDVSGCTGGRFRGVETLTLNNMVQDPTGMHEALIYAFLRAQELPAPRTGWARLTLNGQDLGLYLLVETPDENFLARWWSDPTGNLYEGAYGVDFNAGYEGSFELDEGVDDGRGDLTAVIQALDAGTSDADLARLDTLVDMEQFLRLMAVEALALHWDGYSTANNYRVYRDPQTGRFQMIPSGMDQTFVDYYLGPYDARGRLFTWCLQNRTCAQRYDLALLEMADAWDAWGFEARLDGYVPLVRPELETDPRREYTMDTHAAYVDATRSTMRSTTQRIRDAVSAR